MAEKERASRQVIVISLITAACLIGDSMLYIVLPICFAQAGLSSLWEVGIILSVNRLVRLPLNPMVGWLYRHISDRTGIFIATVLATITTFSYAFADGFAVWLLLRCLWGIAWTLLRLGGFYCILNVSSDDNRGYFMGLYNGLYRIGSLAGMLLGGIFADWLGFSVTCMLFGACTAATIVLGFICVPRGNSGVPAGTQAEERSLTWLWKDGTVLWVMATGLVVALIYQGLYASTLSELIRIHFGSSVTLLGGVAVGAATLGGVLQAIRWGVGAVAGPWDRRIVRSPLRSAIHDGGLAGVRGGRVRARRLALAPAAVACRVDRHPAHGDVPDHDSRFRGFGYGVRAGRAGIYDVVLVRRGSRRGPRADPRLPAQ